METANPPIDKLVVGQASDQRAIAVRHRPPAAGSTHPGFFWLGGYRSDMEGTKAIEIDAHAAIRGSACTRFDYSGHGASGGAFRDGTISRWLEEALAVFDRYADRPQILIGSSMGAWIALRLVATLSERGQGKRVAGLLLLAPAPDFTIDLMEPALTPEQKRDLEQQGYFEEPTPYGPEPNIYTRALFEDGRTNRVLDKPIETGCPVHIIQGMADPDVPHTHAQKLMESLPADETVMTLVRDGDHRLSRPQDIARMLRALDGFIA